MSQITTKRVLLALINLLGIVGVGTILAGRPRLGALQVAITLVALAFSLLPMTHLFGHLSLSTLDPVAIQEQVMAIPLPTLLVCMALSLLGILLFFANWAWSATTTGDKKSH